MASAYDSELARKLNLKSGMKVRVIDPPADVDLGGLSTGDPPDADGVIAFVRTLAEVDAKGDPVLDAAGADRIAWLAYPKGGRLGTDLNRDVLWKHMLRKGVQGVRQVAIDDTWSALRFRPAK
jgi:hypothetical protein